MLLIYKSKPWTMILAYANSVFFLSKVNINNDRKGRFSVLKTFSQLRPSSHTEILPQSLCEDRTSRTKMFLILFFLKRAHVGRILNFQRILFFYNDAVCVIVCC